MPGMPDLRGNGLCVANPAKEGKNSNKKPGKAEKDLHLTLCVDGCEGAVNVKTSPGRFGAVLTRVIKRCGWLGVETRGVGGLAEEC